MTSTLAEISAALAQVLAEGSSPLTTADQVNDLETLFTIESQVHALQLKQLAAAEAVDATIDECGRAPRSWLIEEALVNPSEASKRMRLARQLPGFPKVEAAFQSRGLSMEHASVILTALLETPVEFRDIVETALLELARELAPFLVARGVDELLAACGVEDSADEAAARRHSRRGVSVAETFAGTGSLSGTLSPLLTDKLRHALALAGGPAGDEDGRNSSQRAHDGLETIVDRYLDTADQPDAAGERPARVILTVSLETLEGRLKSAWGVLGSGASICPETARRLACDAEVIPAVLGSRREVLDMGRASRTFSLATRRAATLRDGGRCSFGKCRRPIAELHHIVHWALGGLSDLANAAWLCAFHHWLMHEGGWSMRRNADDSCSFFDANGRDRTSPRHPEAA